MNFRAKIAAAVASVASLVTSAAYAAVPTAASDALTALQTDGEAMIGLIWPVVAAITIGFALFKYFKRGVSKT